MEEGKKKNFRCKKCGAIFEEGADKCPNCGEQIIYPKTILEEREKLLEKNMQEIKNQQNKEKEEIQDIYNLENGFEGFYMTLFLGPLALLYAIARYPIGSIARESFVRSFKITIITLFIIALVLGIVLGIVMG